MSSSTYYVPEQSRWPILASIALFLLAYGAGTLMNALSAQQGGGLWRRAVVGGGVDDGADSGGMVRQCDS